MDTFNGQTSPRDVFHRVALWQCLYINSVTAEPAHVHAAYITSLAATCAHTHLFFHSPPSPYLMQQVLTCLWG